MVNLDETYIGAGIPDVEGTDEDGAYRRMAVNPTHHSNCEACGRRTEVIIIREVNTDDERWFGLCCDRQGDDLPDSDRFPFGK